jgi:hypothetical protein
MPLKKCCAREAEHTVRTHRDVATCDGCGRLVLGYADETTFQLTVDELDAKDVDYDSGRHGDLWIVSKER